MPVLIGLLQSPFVRRVAISMQVLGLPFTAQRLSVFADREAMSSLNPALKVPALTLDDGVQLLDSNLILDWVDRQVAPEQRLLPEGAERWQALQLIGQALVAGEKAVSVFSEYRVRPEGMRSADWLLRCREQVAAMLDLLEASPLLQPRERLDQVLITSAVVLHFVQFAGSRTGEPLFDAARWPRLTALADWAASLPVFQENPLG